MRRQPPLAARNRFAQPLTTLLALTVTLATAFPACAADDASQGSGRVAIPIVIFTPWADPSEGAFSLNVPQNWKISGGTTRNGSIDPRHYVRAVSPDQTITIFLGDPNLIPNQVPDPIKKVGGAHEGQTILGAWGGPVLLARYQTGEEYARGYLARTACASSRSIDTALLDEASSDLADQADEYEQTVGARAEVWVGEATSRCGSQISYVRASTVLAAPARGAGAQVWDVLELSGFEVTSPVYRKLARYILDNMVASFQIDSQWQARQTQTLHDVTEAVTKAQQEMVATIAEHARSEAQTNQIDVISGWLKRNQPADVTPRKETALRRGVTTANEPIGASHTVANDSNYYWTRPDGSIVGTTTDTPPDPDTGWRVMSTR
jgi:hypothetical protein